MVNMDYDPYNVISMINENRLRWRVVSMPIVPDHLISFKPYYYTRMICFYVFKGLCE